MKKVLTKISAVFFALLIVSSTTSFAMDMHYCGDTLVDTSFFSKATTCGMESNELPTEGCSVKKKDCCSDKQIVIEGQDNLKTSFDDLQLNKQYILFAFIDSYIKRFEAIDKKIVSTQKYIPPLVVRTIYKLDETYLI